MSTKHTCTDCRHPIPRNEAVLRSVSFVRVAYCQPCATDRGIVLPSQRTAQDAHLARWAS